MRALTRPPALTCGQRRGQGLGMHRRRGLVRACCARIANAVLPMYLSTLRHAERAYSSEHPASSAESPILMAWSRNLAPLPPKPRWLPPGRRSASSPSFRPGCKCAPAAATALIDPCRPTQGAGWPPLSAAASGKAKERYDRIMRKYRCHGRGAGPLDSDLASVPHGCCTIGKQ